MSEAGGADAGLANPADTDADDPARLADELAALAAGSARCVWLDGGGGRDWSGRRSLVAALAPDDVSLTYHAARREVVRHVSGRSEVVGDDVFTVLEAELAAGGPHDRWFGYLGYAARPDLPARPSLDVPDAVWLRPSVVREVTHPAVPAGLDELDQRGSRPPGGRWSSLSRPPHPSADAVDPAYVEAFARVQEHLHAGDTYEVNLTHRLAVETDLDPVTAYRRLRALNPAPYAGFLQHDVPGARAWLLSSSPERFALLGADRSIETRPIKGTTARGRTPAEDAAASETLRTEARFHAENLMIVDLLRHDLGSVCEPGSVEVPSLMAVESYASVHQLVSTVRGRLREGVGSVQALRALFPPGSMTGAPKLRTMQVIDAVEATPRGAYAGAFGWLCADGRADLGVVIRTLTTTGDGTWHLGTGGGVTVLSDVAAEHAEATLKAARLLAALAGDPGPPPSG